MTTGLFAKEPEPQLLPHQQRVVEEKTELDKKQHALLKFLMSETFRELDDAEKERLVAQRAVMEMYSGILCRRIRAFKRAASAEAKPVLESEKYGE